MATNNDESRKNPVRIVRAFYFLVGLLQVLNGLALARRFGSDFYHAAQCGREAPFRQAKKRLRAQGRLRGSLSESSLNLFVAQQTSKLNTRVRFPSPAPVLSSTSVIPVFHSDKRPAAHSDE